MGRCRRAAAVIAALALAPAAITACSSETSKGRNSKELGPETTLVMDHSGSTAAPTKAAADAGMGDCPQRMPGELLTAEESVVRFSPQMVCLGYLTITVGTPIAWTNLDSVEHTVTITDDKDATVDTFTVAAGAEHRTTSPPTPGIYRFRTTAIESFVGTIEVQKR